MIYGKGSKGNFPMLVKLADKLPIFPKVSNQRSMLYIGNLVEFVRLILDNEEDGTFWPQNAEYSNTSEIVRQIAAVKGRKLLLIPCLTWLLKLTGHATGLVNKAFGNLSYDQSMSQYPVDYRKFSLAESIRLSVASNHS